MTLRWLTDRFAGKPLTDHRVRTTWPTIFNPMTYAGMARLAVMVTTGRSDRRHLTWPMRSAHTGANSDLAQPHMRQT